MLLEIATTLVVANNVKDKNKNHGHQPLSTSVCVLRVNYSRKWLLRERPLIFYFKMYLPYSTTKMSHVREQ